MARGRPRVTTTRAKITNLIWLLEKRFGSHRQGLTEAEERQMQQRLSELGESIPNKKPGKLIGRLRRRLAAV